MLEFLDSCIDQLYVFFLNKWVRLICILEVFSCLTQIKLTINFKIPIRVEILRFMH